MADTEGFNLIVNGTTQVVGVQALLTGVIPSGPGAGNNIYAAEVGIRANSALVGTGNPLSTSDSGAQSALATIAGNTAGSATAALQGTGNTSLASLVTANGTDGTGIVQPTGGAGIRGWLSGIYSKLLAGLTITGTVTTTDSGTPATGVNPATGATGVIGWLSMIFNALASGVFIKTAQYTPIALDNTSVTTAGTPVNALNAGHATAGGFIHTTNAAGMYVAQIGSAGTVDGGSTVFVPANTTYTVIPSAAAVSVNSTASATAIAGYGAN